MFYKTYNVHYIAIGEYVLLLILFSVIYNKTTFDSRIEFININVSILRLSCDL